MITMRLGQARGLKYINIISSLFMRNYSSRIDKIKKEFPAIQKEDFTPATDGTHYKAFLSPDAMLSSYFCPPAKLRLIAYELKNK